MTNHTTSLDLDDIEARAAHLYEYGQMDSQDGQNALDQLTDTDVPALLAENRKLRAELAAVRALCDEQEMAARLFELPEPEWVQAVRRAVSVVSGAADSRQA